MMINVSQVRQTLSLTEDELQLLQNCIESYYKNLNFFSVYSKISNICYSVFGQSEWQATQRMMEVKVVKFINDKCSLKPEPSQLQKIAQTFSKFLLKFLVSQHSTFCCQSQDLIPKEIMEQLNKQVTIETLILKAIKNIDNIQTSSDYYQFLKRK